MLVFFYGLFMDPAKLKQHGVRECDIRRAWALDRKLVIAKRATLVSRPGACTPGVLADVSRKGLEALYAGPDMKGYYADTVEVRFEDGVTAVASSWVADLDLGCVQRDASYTEQLRKVRLLYDLPVDDLN